MSEKDIETEKLMKEIWSPSIRETYLNIPFVPHRPTDAMLRANKKTKKGEDYE